MWHITCYMWKAHDGLHVIAAWPQERMCWDSLSRSEESVKISNCAFQWDYYYYYYPQPHWPCHRSSDTLPPGTRAGRRNPPDAPPLGSPPRLSLSVHQVSHQQSINHQIITSALLSVISCYVTADHLWSAATCLCNPDWTVVTKEALM